MFFIVLFYLILLYYSVLFMYVTLLHLYLATVVIVLGKDFVSAPYAE